MTAPSGREIAAQHGEAVGRDERIVQRANDVLVVDLCRASTFSPMRAAVHRARVRRQPASDRQLLQHAPAGRRRSRSPPSDRRRTDGCWRAAASRAQVCRMPPGRASARRGARARSDARPRWSSRRSRARRRPRCGSIARVMRSDGFRSSQTMSTMRFPGPRRHHRVARVGRRDRGRARQRHAERLGGAGHRRGGAHRHAVAGRAGDAVLDLLPVLGRDRAGAQIRPNISRRRCPSRAHCRASCRAASGPRA